MYYGRDLRDWAIPHQHQFIAYVLKNNWVEADETGRTDVTNRK